MKIITDLKDKIILVLAGLLAIAIFIICFKGCGPNKPTQYYTKPGFKTDTVKIKVPYLVKGDSFPYYIPPKAVIEYLASPKNDDHLKIINDSLIDIINSLGEIQGVVNENFVSEYSTSPKLIGGLFTKDTFRLDLLHSDGKIFSNIYPIDYGNFKYQWVNDDLRSITIGKPAPVKPTFGWGIYGNVGYEILSKKPFGSMDYYITYGKFRINIEPRFTIESKPILEINSKLGFRIK